jgi:hypothetical protein
MGDPPESRQPQTLSRSLTRALSLGVCGALLVGGMGLLLLGARTLFLPPPCSPPDSPQCSLEEQLSRTVARQQALIGGLMSLLGLSLSVLLRPHLRKPGEAR